MTNINKDTYNSSKMIVFVVALIVIIFGLIFLGVIFINFAFIKNSQIQQQKYFEYSMHVIQQQQGNLIGVPMDVPRLGPNKDFISSQQRQLVAPSQDGSDNDTERLSKLIETCTSYSVEIDEITRRKNCSKNVAELVYKISKHLGHSEFDSMVFYAVGLVYDIGFLSIDQSIFDKEQISEDEFEILKAHAEIGVNMINFVDEDLRGHFKDGILKHHENLDGTGYPKGIKDKSIPYIARVIRVVESFISLISSRKYRKITDKETAINMLIEEKGKYDKKILEALNNII